MDHPILINLDQFVQFDIKKFSMKHTVNIIFLGETAGRLRTYKNFQFLQIYNAGHMVPMDQPLAASEMLNSWLEGNLGIISQKLP